MSARTVAVHVKDGFDVYMGRAMRGYAGSRFANPFRIEPGVTRAQAIERYRVHLRALLESDPSLRAELETLRGKRLGCWCKPLDCHVDVVVEILEGPAQSPARPCAQQELF